MMAYGDYIPVSLNEETLTEWKRRSCAIEPIKNNVSLNEETLTEWKHYQPADLN